MVAHLRQLRVVQAELLFARPHALAPLAQVFSAPAIVILELPKPGGCAAVFLDRVLAQVSAHDFVENHRQVMGMPPLLKLFPSIVRTVAVPSKVMPKSRSTGARALASQLSMVIRQSAFTSAGLPIQLGRTCQLLRDWGM